MDSRQRVHSAPKAKEIAGAGDWTHEHRHLVLMGNLDLKEKGACLQACPCASMLGHQGSGVSSWASEKPEFGKNGAQGSRGHQEEEKRL